MLPNACAETHEVTNQVPPLDGANLYRLDVPLQQWVARFGGVGGFARETSAGAIELTRDLFQPIVLERNSVGVERIGLDQVRARLQVFGVDIADQGGLREAQDVIGSEKIGVGVGKALTPEVLFTELVALNHRAHRAV